MHPFLNTGGGVFWFTIIILMVYSRVKVFEKAGYKWWEAIIPIYTTYIFIKISGKPGWWILLFLIPLVNIVILVIVTHNLSLRFGRSAGFTLGLIFLPFVFYPILGLGDSVYKPVAQVQVTM